MILQYQTQWMYDTFLEKSIIGYWKGVEYI